MPIDTGYPPSRNRNMEKSPVPGATPRAYETHPKAMNPQEGQKTRGKENKNQFSFGKIPNKKG